MQSRTAPTTATGAVARAPPVTMVSPSLLSVPLRWSPRPSSGRRGSACATSDWHACSGVGLRMQPAHPVVCCVRPPPRAAG
eukprot:14385990-Alexandrium_andersonii.AAC.1